MSALTYRNLRTAAGHAGLLGTIVVLAFIAASGRPVAALTACAASDIGGHDPGCPGGTGTCTITSTFTVGNGCTLDFSGRNVTIGSTGVIDINSGTVKILSANFTVVAGGLIDGRGQQTTAPDNKGGMITIEATGGVNVQKSGTTNGRIDVSATAVAGTIVINAGASVAIAGLVSASQLSINGDGGTIQIQAAGDIVTLAGSTLTASAGINSNNGGGEIDLNADGRVLLNDAMDVSGSTGGTVDIGANGSVTAQMINANGTGDGGSGGEINIEAGTTVTLADRTVARGNGPLVVGSSGGCGGSICIAADFGDITAVNDVLADGAAPDGGGGQVDFCSQGATTISSGAMLSARSNGGQGCGGLLCIQTFRPLVAQALLDASGGAGGGELDICASTDITLNGGVDVSGRNSGGQGGTANITAGVDGPGSLVVQSKIDATGGACDPNLGCGQGGAANLSGCGVTVTSAGSAVAGAPTGGTVTVTASEQLTIAGKLNAAATSAPGPDGKIVLVYPQRKPPVVNGPVQPAPTAIPQDTCSPTVTQNCLVPCPVCGDGITEFPETCDDGPGTPLSCDGCSTLCQFENCDDGLLCTIDSCDQLLGCRHLPAPTGCIEPPTPTHTPSATPTVTATLTNTPTPRPTATATPTVPPTATMTSTRQPTFTASVTPTLTPTLTVSPTPAVPGDANCDARIEAGDVVGSIQALALGRLSCGADVNGDGTVDAADIAAIIRRLFAVP